MVGRMEWCGTIICQLCNIVVRQKTREEKMRTPLRLSFTAQYKYLRWPFGPISTFINYEYENLKVGLRNLYGRDF